MKKYNIRVQEIKSTEFQLEAKNKKEAQKKVEEIIYETCILNLSCVKHEKEINFIINKIKKFK